MKSKVFAIIGIISLGLSGVSCKSTNAKLGLPIPFTDPAVKVNVETNVTPLPPKICIGLDVVEIEG